MGNPSAAGQSLIQGVPANDKYFCEGICSHGATSVPDASSQISCCRSDSMTVDRSKAYFPRTDSDSQASRLVHVDAAIAQLPRAPSSFSHSVGTYPVNSMLPVTQQLSYQMGLEQGLYSHVPSIAGGRN